MSIKPLKYYVKDITLRYETIVRRKKTTTDHKLLIYNTKDIAKEFHKVAKDLFINKKKISLKGCSVWIDKTLPISELRERNKGIKITSKKREADYEMIDIHDILRTFPNLNEFSEMEAYYNKSEDIYYMDPGIGRIKTSIIQVDNGDGFSNLYKFLSSDRYLNPIQYLFGEADMDDAAINRLHSMVRSPEKEMFNLFNTVITTYNPMKYISEISLLYSYVNSDDIRNPLEELEDAYDEFSGSKYGLFISQNFSFDTDSILSVIKSDELYHKHFNDDYEYYVTNPIQFVKIQFNKGKINKKILCNIMEDHIRDQVDLDGINITIS